MTFLAPWNLGKVLEWRQPEHLHMKDTSGQSWVSSSNCHSKGTRHVKRGFLPWVTILFSSAGDGIPGQWPSCNHSATSQEVRLEARQPLAPRDSGFTKHREEPLLWMVFSIQGLGCWKVTKLQLKYERKIPAESTRTGRGQERMTSSCLGTNAKHV